MHGRRVAARKFYDGYMSSPAWWSFRRDWFAWAQSHGDVVCLGCARKWTLRDDLHHVTYERLSAEKFEDLWPLCRACHEFVHEVIDRREWRRVGRIQAHQAALRALRRYHAKRDKELGRGG